MTWEQKLQALNALTKTEVHFRKPGDWYCSGYAREIKNGGILAGRYGNGSTPQEAVENDWREMTELIKPDEYIVIYNPERKAARWNGFMWQPVQERL